MKLNTGLWLPTRRGHSSVSAALGGGGASAPSAPPGTPTLWWKAGATCFSDAGTTPCTDGAAVYQWDDAGATELDLQQTVEVNRPAYRANYATTGYPGVEFAEASDADYLEKSGEPDLTGAVTAFAAIHLDAAGGGEIYNQFQANGSTENDFRLAVQAADDLLVFGRPYATADDQVSTATVLRSQWVVVGVAVGAATGSADMTIYPRGAGSGEAKTLNANGVHNDGDARMGGFDSQFFDDTMDGAIGELIIYHSLLSAGDLATLIAYLEGQHGI